MVRPKLTYTKTPLQQVKALVVSGPRLPLLILAAILLISAPFVYFQFKKSGQPATPEIILPTLPSGWTQSDDIQGNIILRFQKEITSNYQPTIVLAVSNLNSEVESKDYVPRIIKGARSTIPSLNYTKNETVIDQNGVSITTLNGAYTASRQKINLTQQIYIKGTKIYTVTLSSLQSQVESSEFDTIVKDFISPKIVF